MKRIAIVASALALVAIMALAIPSFAQGPSGGYPPFGGMMGGYGRGDAPGQTITPTVPYGSYGMMGGYGYGNTPNQTVTQTVPFGYGPYGMMGSYGTMGGYGYGVSPNANSITLDQATTNARNYAASMNNPDLELDEIEEYAWNFYVVVKEKNTDLKAFQLLVDKNSGAVYPEMGPNRMWNTKYSPMAWMMGTLGQTSDQMSVSVDDARANAAAFLKSYYPNTTLDASPDTFYGYYNFDVMQNGKPYGMLSVNGYTGAVWYHTWHGAFIAAQELN